MQYRGGNVNFPLYLYPDSKKDDLFANHSHGKRTPNIAPKLMTELGVRGKSQGCKSENHQIKK
jgi:hypothetical protein